VLDSQKGTADVYGVGSVPDGAGHVPDGVAGWFIGDAGVGAEDGDGAGEVRDGGGYGGFDGGFGADVALETVEVRWVCTVGSRVGAEVVGWDFATLCCGVLLVSEEQDGEDGLIFSEYPVRLLKVGVHQNGKCVPPLAKRILCLGWLYEPTSCPNSLIGSEEMERCCGHKRFQEILPRNSSTIALPIPPAAPVTNTCRPSSSRKDIAEGVLLPYTVPSLHFEQQSNSSSSLKFHLAWQLYPAPPHT
jgi:hypothetical protein